MIHKQKKDNTTSPEPCRGPGLKMPIAHTKQLWPRQAGREARGNSGTVGQGPGSSPDPGTAHLDIAPKAQQGLTLAHISHLRR